MFKKLLIGLGVLFLVIIVSTAVGGGGDETGTTAPTAITQEETMPVEEEPAAEPKAGNVVGNWRIIGKIIPKADGLGDFTTTFRVENTSDAPDSPLLTVNVLKGNTIFASMDCSGGEVGPGQIGTVDCVGLDKFRRGWTEVTVENMF